MGLTPLKAVTRAPAYGPLVISVRTVKTLRSGIVPRSEYLLCCRNFPFSEPPVFARFTDEITSTSSQHISAYGLPSSDLRVREPLADFLCLCHSTDGIVTHKESKVRRSA